MKQVLDKDLDLEMLAASYHQISQCNRCGSCLAVCPVYGVELKEINSPRGKMALARHLKNNDLEFSPRLSNIISQCLLCGSCLSVCPSGVQGSHIFSELRREAVRRLGQDWRKLLMSKLLSSANGLEEGVRFARLARSIMDTLAPRGITLDRFDFSFLPDFSTPFFRYRVSKVIHPAGKPRGKVAYFYGCATDYLFAEVGEATVKALSRAGYEVYIPPEQVCCSIPVFMSGNYEMALPNILRNIDLLTSGPWENVVVDCATCGLAFKYEYPRVLEALGENPETARILSARILDVTQLLCDLPVKMGVETGEHKKPVTVTYHDPCHLAKGQKITEEPRRMLKNSPHLEYVEMPQADSCCGGGGAFQFDHPEIASRITGRKINNIVQTGAQVVATGCPSCRITLRKNLKGRAVRVCHPVELLEL